MPLSFSLRYNRDEIFVRDDEQEVRLLNTFGFYWHFFMKVSEALRSIHNDEGPATAGEEASTKTEFKWNDPDPAATWIRNTTEKTWKVTF